MSRSKNESIALSRIECHFLGFKVCEHSKTEFEELVRGAVIKLMNQPDITKNVLVELNGEGGVRIHTIPTRVDALKHLADFKPFDSTVALALLLHGEVRTLDRSTCIGGSFLGSFGLKDGTNGSILITTEALPLTGGERMFGTSELGQRLAGLLIDGQEERTIRDDELASWTLHLGAQMETNNPRIFGAMREVLEAAQASGDPIGHIADFARAQFDYFDLLGVDPFELAGDFDETRPSSPVAMEVVLPWLLKYKSNHFNPMKLWNHFGVSIGA